MDIVEFQNKILNWYDLNKRDLPWRHTINPYHILISEVMSQQTQVDRVKGYYKRWLTILPDFASLAKVSKHELLALWSGLGYNSRALRLQQLAIEVVTTYHGKLPQSETLLLKLPGLGPYTARAVLAFAFNKEVPVIDTNIRRVLIHELGLSEDISVKELEGIARMCVPQGKSRDWHNALMDYGATHITARKTGIKPLSKQGKFKGSDREVRGYITKQLVQHKMAVVSDIKDAFPKKEVDDIIAKMQNDGLLIRDGNQVMFE